MAFEVRESEDGSPLASFKDLGDAIVGATGILRAQKLDHCTLAWGLGDGTLTLTKPGGRNPTLYVVKTDLRMKPKSAVPAPIEPAASKRAPGRPVKDPTSMADASLPIGTGVWLALKGKDRKIAAYPRADFIKPPSFMTVGVYLNADGKVLQEFKRKAVGPAPSTAEMQRDMLDEVNYPWPEGTSHLLTGTATDGTFTARSLYRKSAVAPFGARVPQPERKPGNTSGAPARRF